MQLDSNLWLADAYYIDIDDYGQIRVVGPNNHLYFGSLGLSAGTLRILDIRKIGAEIEIDLELAPHVDFLPDPAIGHIRRVRDLIQRFGRPDATFAEAYATAPGQLGPQQLTTEIIGGHPAITYLRRYGLHYYGVRLLWPHGTDLRRNDERRGFEFDASEQPQKLRLHTISDELPVSYHGAILKPFPVKITGDSPGAGYAAGLIDRTTVEIDHLVRHNKTSGFDYGTVFPRDWMETADLLSDQLTPDGLHHLYAMALLHVGPSGSGWHEDVIGEYKYEREQQIENLSHGFDTFVSRDHPLSPQFRGLLEQLDELFVTRLMIDIEPHYLLGLRFLSYDKLAPHERTAIHRVANFVLRQAEEHQLISFQKLGLPFRRQRGDEYYTAGNWRDSTLAYQKISPIIAPYDVNVVFYPQALRVIRDRASDLGFEPERVQAAIDKWDTNAERYRFTNADGTAAYALALHSVATDGGELSYKQLRINHLDEAYNLFYGTPTEAEVESFTRRLMSEKYFYTPSGPILVGQGEGYDSSQYHGEVIWTKQTAYVIRGLERQLTYGQNHNWRQSVLEELTNAISQTASASLAAFRSLGAIPELHYDDNGSARLYTDQPSPEGQMNTVQLWSAAGARVILEAALRYNAQ